MFLHFESVIIFFFFFYKSRGTLNLIAFSIKEETTGFRAGAGNVLGAPIGAFINTRNEGNSDHTSWEYFIEKDKPARSAPKVANQE